MIMTENIIYAISKDVYNVYKELSINGLNISIEEKNKLINKLKKLINNEKEIYSYLSYEEISKVRDYFVKNFSSDEEISGNKDGGKAIISKLKNPNVICCVAETNITL